MQHLAAASMNQNDGMRKRLSGNRVLNEHLTGDEVP
jgi:hypothetical protein